jgi:hypothetical protein
MWMLPDFRFIIGALLAVALLAVTALGFVTALRLPHQAARMGPFETSRSLAFDDRSEWNPFYDPENARRVVGLVPHDARPQSERPPDSLMPIQPEQMVAPTPTRADVAPVPPEAATPARQALPVEAAPAPPAAAASIRPADAPAGDDKPVVAATPAATVPEWPQAPAPEPTMPAAVAPATHAATRMIEPAPEPEARGHPTGDAETASAPVVHPREPPQTILPRTATAPGVSVVVPTETTTSETATRPARKIAPAEGPISDQPVSAERPAAIPIPALRATSDDATANPGVKDEALAPRAADTPPPAPAATAVTTAPPAPRAEEVAVETNAGPAAHTVAPSFVAAPEPAPMPAVVPEPAAHEDEVPTASLPATLVQAPPEPAVTPLLPPPVPLPIAKPAPARRPARTAVHTPPEPPPHPAPRPRVAVPPQQRSVQPTYQSSQQYWQEPQYQSQGYAPRPATRGRSTYDPWQGWTGAR